VLALARRPAAFHHHPDRVGRTDRRVRHIRRDEERLPFLHRIIDDAITLAMRTLMSPFSW
jgi:hypothetical protein